VCVCDVCALCWCVPLAIVCVNRNPSIRRSWNGSLVGFTASSSIYMCIHIWPLHDIAITYMVLCMAYKWGSGGRLILPNSRAIVLQQCGKCRWAGRMKGRLIRARTTKSEQYLVKAKYIYTYIYTYKCVCARAMRALCWCVFLAIVCVNRNPLIRSLWNGSCMGIRHLSLYLYMCIYIHIYI